MVTDVDCVVKGILHSPPSSINNEGKNQKKNDVSFRLAFCFLYALSRLLFYLEIHHPDLMKQWLSFFAFQ